MKICYSEDTIQPILQKMFSDCSIQELLDAAEDILLSPVSFTPSYSSAKIYHSKKASTGGAPHLVPEPLMNDHAEYVMGRLNALPVDCPVITQGGPGIPQGHILTWAMHGNSCYGLVCIQQRELPLEEIDLKLVVFLSKCIAQVAASHRLLVPLSPDELLERVLSGEINSAVQLNAVPNIDKLIHPQSAMRILCLPQPGGELSMTGSIIQMQFHGFFPGCWCAWTDTAFCVLLDIRHGDVLQDEKSNARLKKIGETYGCPICVGPVFDDLLRARTLFRHMLSIPALRSAADGERVFYENHMECSLIYEADLPQRELRALCTPLIAELRSFDNLKGTEYLRTLRTYLECHLNATQAAHCLHVHPNTAIYRINRMQELFHFDLLDTNTLFNLLFSMRIEDYIER